MNTDRTHLIQHNNSAREALRQLNDLGMADSVLFVINSAGKVIGSLTDGDVRRGLLKDLQIDQAVNLFMNPSFHYLYEKDFTKDKILRLRNLEIFYVPIVNKNHKIVKILSLNNYRAVIDVDAVLMAGGRGERLSPLTDKIPKPLLKVGNKAIIEHNIDRLSYFGVRHFNITIKYLANQIRKELGNGEEKNIQIKYQEETEPLGTIGAVSNIENFNHDDIIIMNSDLLTNIDFGDFYDSFIETKVDFAMATVPYEVSVPYAVMEIGKNNRVLGFSEKPKYTYYSNAGIYITKKKLLNLIPKNKKFDATEFIELLINKKYKVASFPLIGYWLDIGRMQDYLKAQEDIKHLHLL